MISDDNGTFPLLRWPRATGVSEQKDTHRDVGCSSWGGGHRFLSALKTFLYLPSLPSVVQQGYIISHPVARWRQKGDLALGAGSPPTHCLQQRCTTPPPPPRGACRRLLTASRPRSVEWKTSAPSLRSTSSNMVLALGSHAPYLSPLTLLEFQKESSGCPGTTARVISHSQVHYP